MTLRPLWKVAVNRNTFRGKFVDDISYFSGGLKGPAGINSALLGVLGDGFICLM